MRPPRTLCSCIVSETLAIAPQSQRHVCKILWLARSLLLQSSRMSPFRRPVSAAKNSVPGASFGDWFDLCVGSMQFGPDRLHHPVFPNRGNRPRSKRGRFCGDLVAYLQRSRSLPTITVSRVNSWPPVSASKNSVPGDWILGRNRPADARDRLLRCELRAASGPIAGSIRALRTVGSIPRERRGVARHQCRGANDLRPQL